MDLLAPGLITMREAAARLGLRVQSFRNQYGERVEPVGFVGSTAVLRESDIEAIAEERKANPRVRRPFPLSVKYD